MLALVLALSIQAKSLVHGGLTYEVRIDRKAERPLQVWRGGHKLAEALLKRFHPWSLQIADVDGDDVDEIAVGVTKPTPNLPFPHRTLFIMRFDGTKIWRKWAGSTMGRPLLEYCFGPKTHGQPQLLFTLEKQLDGQVALAANRWSGFGFRKVGTQRAWPHASGLHCVADKLIVVINHRNVAVPWKSLQ